MEIKFFVFLFCARSVLSSDTLDYKFHDAFSFGVATSAYQVEGAWNVSGKGLSFWDYFTHNTEGIEDGSNGDIACDSYNKIDEDIRMLKDLGVTHYRFSVSWARIFPTGLRNNINWEGVAYYDKLISKLLEAEIEPWVTIYHFDLPYSVHLVGGWFQHQIVDYVTDLADFLFYTFGERVKTWITINEPLNICYSGMDAINVLMPKGSAEYLCGENVLRAHASIYRLYDKKYRKKQNGKLSMAFSLQAYLPASTKPEDIEAAERLNQFAFGWFVHPLVFGNYPQTMIDIIGNYSELQGFPKSRLPELSLVDGLMLRGAYDFIGLNNYDTFLISNNNSNIDKVPSFENDYGANIVEPKWNTSYSIHMKSTGLRTILNWIKNSYNDPEIRITEQGLPEDTTELADFNRHTYLTACLGALQASIVEDNVTVTGYTFWSLMDNFEWNKGYTKKYGLFFVDFNDPKRTRIVRMSALSFSYIAKNKRLKGLDEMFNETSFNLYLK